MSDIVDEIRDLFLPSDDPDQRQEDWLGLAAADEIEHLRAQLAKAGRDHITLQTNFAKRIATAEAVVEAARRRYQAIEDKDVDAMCRADIEERHAIRAYDAAIAPQNAGSENCTDAAKDNDVNHSQNQTQFGSF